MNKGFSIVEFMVAITLGTLLVATVGSVYVSNKATYRVQEALARLQENARYANYYLNLQLRMAGYQGCASENSVTMTNRVKNPSNVLIYDTPILGFDGLTSSFSPALPSNLVGKSVANSDVIEVRMAANTNVQLDDDMNLPNNPIHVYDRLNIQAGDVLMISNCKMGDIFVAGSDSNATVITHSSNNNTSNDLSTSYTAGAQIMRYIYYGFYVKNTGRVNSQTQPIYALARIDLNGNEQELVDGVEQMRIRYGVDTNNDNAADTYQTATEVNTGDNWNNVISLKINLLLASSENVSPQIQSYKFNGSNVTPSDHKLRREWETFITLRNRGLPS
jgi:type IV pilus assembly protein PilW